MPACPWEKVVWIRSLWGSSLDQRTSDTPKQDFRLSLAPASSQDKFLNHQQLVAIPEERQHPPRPVPRRKPGSVAQKSMQAVGTVDSDQVTKITESEAWLEFSKKHLMYLV